MVKVNYRRITITGIDGQSRTSDEHTDRPICKFGMSKNLNMAPSQIDIICNSYLVFSNTGQIHAPFKSFVMEQIRHKLIAFKGKL